MAADMNLLDLIKEYGSEEKCRRVLEHLRWPNGPVCPRCASDKTSPIKNRPRYDCDKCHYQFSVTVGTIFGDSHLPLTTWFLATYMMIEAKKGVSANQLKRTLAVSYKTAWYLCHRIRGAMKEAGVTRLGGIVEIDETYIGGKRRGVGGGTYRNYMTAVVGAVQRGGNVRLKVINRVNANTLKRFINETTQPQASAIYTDDANVYDAAIHHSITHESVNHSAEEWVRADVHTNTVEGVWSLLKRSIVGSYHQLSTKHLPAYLDEIAFRHNNRSNPFLFRDTLLKLLAAKTMPFKELVKGVQTG